MKTLTIVLLVGVWPLAAQADYFRGIDDLKRNDIGGAIRELSPLADAGEADAQNALGVAYSHSNDGTGATRSRQMFRRAADNGLLLGMMNLARSLQSDRDGPGNPGEAAEWLTHAAQEGYVPAMVLLGDAYRSGLGLPSDKVSAQAWYERAAKLGDAAGMAGVADMLFESSEPALKAVAMGWLQRASDQGNPHAQQELALAKLHGLNGLPIDQAGALALARSAATKGDGLAAVILAESYQDGIGMPASAADAVHWYAEAARQGALRGQVETAKNKLAPGPGHQPDIAYFWLQIAARHPGILQATIASLDQAAARELKPLQQEQMRALAAKWQVGGAP